MRKVTEVLRLLWAQGRSAREVAKSCQLARNTVKEYERRALAPSPTNRHTQTVARTPGA